MHSCSEVPTPETPVGAGGKRSIPDGSEDTCVGADTPAAEALLKEGVADGDARTELFKLAVRTIVEEALEAEVSDVLGRGYYESGAEPGRGYRNGTRRR